MFRIQIVLKTNRAVDELQVISIQTWTGPDVQQTEAPSMSRNCAHKGGKVVSPTRLPLLSPRRRPWYSLLLGAESTPGPYCGRKD